MTECFEKKLAPIGLSTYSRLGHLKKTVEALQKNELANESELFVFSDAPKLGDEDKVQAVRDYLKTIDGFKKIYIYERKENNRVANNRGGMRMLLDKYGRMIFVEEDSVTSPNFLNFMNKALEKYKDDKRVFGICGYTPPIKIPSDYTETVMLLPRFFAYAFAMWKDKFELIDMDISLDDFSSTYYNRQKNITYCSGGNDVMPQLLHVARGKVEALDIRIDYSMYKYDMLTLQPRCSLVKNIGFDGSGENWTSSTSKFDVDVDKSFSFQFPERLELNKQILAKEKEFLDLPWPLYIDFYVSHHRVLGYVFSENNILNCYVFVKKVWRFIKISKK